MRNDEALRIGVFDSGLGGLTVVQSLTKVIKGAEIFYIADTKNAPYGEKTPEQILQYSLKITEYFIDNHQIDALIIACNTATSAAVKILREKFPQIIIIGTEPGIKPAIEQTNTGKVGVLATPATLKGNKYQQLVNALAHEKDVVLFEQACPGLVEQIEKGKKDDSSTKAMLEMWLAPMKDSSVDTIVLGCTHYPLVAEMIEYIMQRELNLIHTGEAIAKRLLALGQEKGHDNEGALKITLYSTDHIDQDLVTHILGKTMNIKQINIGKNGTYQ
ncbi:MAG: glutamate racemase [Epsilonproteobacteria bacterium (ex Lamellibrachia satsuma)]|nr:MAG: glutamate racemase [Epsilonproteobacteria bacterium (ex Lamellibrachia satsuma)]